MVEIIDEHENATPFEHFELNIIGVYLYSDFLLFPGDKVHLRIKLSSCLRPIHAIGEVVRAETGNERLMPGMGVAFKNMDNSDQKELERFLMIRRFLGHV
ncbi:MAG: hypothetical protein GY847_08520 [Proteobacteria bacterium]|nr:hypothetical protein [Pseudomonadota bacterium]